MSKKVTYPVHIIKNWRLALLWPLSLIVRIWAASLRFEMNQATRELLKDTEKPKIFLFWHNRLFLAAEIHRRFRSKQRSVFGLVSASKDGAWLAAFFALVGIGTVRGSTSKRSAQAMRDLLEKLKTGGDIAITPDGPRGPCYDFKPGGLLLARKANVPLLLASTKFYSAWRFKKSWDGFYLPKPFSKVTVSARCYAEDHPLIQKDPPRTTLLHLKAILNELTTD